jgi:HEAT repeat protein
MRARAAAPLVLLAAALGAPAAIAAPGDPTAVSRLERAFQDGSPAAIRLAAARAVVLEDTPDATAAVCRALGKTYVALDRLADERRRARADLPSLGRKVPPGIGDPSLREANSRADEVPERQILAMLRKALGALREPESRTILERQARTASEPRVRADALEALAAVSRAGAVPALRAAQADRDWLVRASAASGLGRLAPSVPDAEEGLIAALEDADFGVRLVAARGIAGAPTPASIGRLAARVAKEEGRVAREMGGLLGAVTGQNFGALGESWARWWQDAKEAYAAGTAKLHATDGPTFRKGTATPAVAGERLSYHGITIDSKRVIFILDVSMSMNGMAGNLTRIDHARGELVRVIRALDPASSFGIWCYGDRVDSWKSGLVKAAPKAKEEAVAWANALVPYGQTNTHAALEEAFRAALSPEASYGGGADTIFLLSDGAPTAPRTLTEGRETDAIVEAVAAWNRHRRVAIHCVAAGGGADSSFLGRLARENTGELVTAD